MNSQGSQFDFDLGKYSELLKAVGSLSSLFSENTDNVYFVSRFIEKLYVYASGAEDLSRLDNSFDALIRSSNKGVGVKTFGVSNINSVKSEKVAELTAHASSGEFRNLSHEDLAQKVAKIRNDKITSDSNEYGIDLSSSIYHCLIRTQSGALVHEESYPLINLDQIHPTNSSGTKVSSYDTKSFPYFTDGQGFYTFNTSKNTLFKKFDISKGNNSPLIELETVENIFEEIIRWARSRESGAVPAPIQNLEYLITPKKPIRPFVVLPLYSSEAKGPKVYPKSGINQWNAGGRKRKFGEAYIPVPSSIHEDNPEFFPSRDTTFQLKLPNGKTVLASICQDGGKALMSNPNDELCEWLFRTIDINFEQTKIQRMAQSIPYTFEDLENIGKDSVRVFKNEDGSFEIEFMTVGSYEKFKNGENLDYRDSE